MAKSPISKRDEFQVDRRRVLRLCCGIVTAAAWPTVSGATSTSGSRTLRFVNLHTDERVSATYWVNGHYVADELKAVDWLLRDYRNNIQFPIAPQLLDLLHTLQLKLGTSRGFHVISGYRSPQTNAILRAKSKGVAEKSLHMEGKAIDIRIPKRSISQIRDAALSLAAGGVGTYHRTDFVHLDIGRVRSWQQG